MKTLSAMGVGVERLRNARPDSVRSIEQLAVGKIVVGFGVYLDLGFVINRHLSSTVLIEGSAFRITGEMEERKYLGKNFPVEPLETFTLKPRAIHESLLKHRTDAEYLQVDCMGIEGVDMRELPAGQRKGLIEVSQVPYTDRESLQIGPNLWIDGRNDYRTICDGQFMAVALNSDRRLA